MILPFSTTQILSAFLIVDNLWAITMVVRFVFCINSSRAACTMRSDSLSRALVASSSRRMLGFLIIARAIAMRCFCPPESLPPFSPTSVLYLSLKDSMNEWALHICAASITSWSEEPGFPARILSMMLPMNRTGSCPTRPMVDRSHCKFSSLKSTPSKVTAPCSGS
mmetsp:Transcript_30852/g.48349  ORF Transcript_30852/g.48349 Transcript_30852/m.48349 type:complete len:166 (-) Transcript_30852:2198-2695(-)